MDYGKMNVAALKAECKDRGITGYSKLRKEDLIAALEAHEAPKVSEPEPVQVKGRSVGATTMAMRDKLRSESPVFIPRAKYPNQQARNRAKARRRALRAAGFQAGS